MKILSLIVGTSMTKDNLKDTSMRSIVDDISDV